MNVVRSRSLLWRQLAVWSIALVGFFILLACSAQLGIRTLVLLIPVWGTSVGFVLYLRRSTTRMSRSTTSIVSMVVLLAAVTITYLVRDKVILQSRYAYRSVASSITETTARPIRWWRAWYRDRHLAERPSWTTSRLIGSPDPLPPFESRQAFKNLRFKNPVAMTWSETGDRWFLAEEQGRIRSFSDARESDHFVEVLDLRKPLFGLAIHPRFAENGYLFASYLDKTSSEMRVSRFHVDRKSGIVDPKSESQIIVWKLQGHPGGCLEFGPDEMLYISVGDKGPYDPGETGQDLSDLQGSILRINIDVSGRDTAYTIPPDNPFVDLKDARPEIWAYGLRHVWKMTFDQATGELWAGDVGQDLWESVHLIQRGGNSGWSLYEGRHPIFPNRKAGPTPITLAVVDQSHSIMRSITGGYVYRGHKLPELEGKYLYADYDTGTIWSVERREDGEYVNTLIADTENRISAFAIDRTGEILIVDHVGGEIFELERLVPTEQQIAAIEQFPRKLSQTGLFSSTADYLPEKGLVPYAVNSELWSDGAIKDRFLAVNDQGRIDFEAIPMEEPEPGWNFWQFPNGSALVKTFSLELERGNQQSRRRVETRVMVVEDLPDDPQHYYRNANKLWHVYTYAWNEDQTDADLVERDGLDRPYEIFEPETGKFRSQIWHYPSRFECMMCHTRFSGFLLGVKSAQMNRSGLTGKAGENQLTFLDRSRLIDRNVATAPLVLPRMVDPKDDSAPLEQRVRSYLHANCSHCHMPSGGGNSPIDLRYYVPLVDTHLINERPLHGDLGISGARLVVPGDPEASLLLQRMMRLGQGRMPKVGSNVVDVEGSKLVRQWIEQLKPEPHKTRDKHSISYNP